VQSQHVLEHRPLVLGKIRCLGRLREDILQIFADGLARAQAQLVQEAIEPAFALDLAVASFVAHRGRSEDPILSRLRP
jgi:hypothetical protein